MSDTTLGRNPARTTTTTRYHVYNHRGFLIEHYDREHWAMERARKEHEMAANIAQIERRHGKAVDRDDSRFYVVKMVRTCSMETVGNFEEGDSETVNSAFDASELRHAGDRPPAPEGTGRA